MGEKWIEELFEKEYPALLLYGISLTHSRFEAEDLVQEAFYRFLLIYDSLSSDNYRGWLFRVMRNYFYDGQRKEKNKKKLVKYLKKEYKGTTADLLEEFIQSNEREALFQKIQQIKTLIKKFCWLITFWRCRFRRSLNFCSSSQIMSKSCCIVGENS